MLLIGSIPLTARPVVQVAYREVEVIVLSGFLCKQRYDLYSMRFSPPWENETPTKQ